MSGSLTFYTNPMSRGRIIRWMLEETGQDYTAVILDFETTLKAPNYLAINPMGKVPAIVHNGHTVTECAAICAYLADAFPEANLAPPLSDRAEYYRWLFFAAGPTEQAIITRSLGFEVTAEQSRTAGFGSFEKMCEVLSKSVEGRSYIAGNQFTAADVYLGSQIGWGLQFGTLPKLPAFEQYVAGLYARPAYLAATQLDDALLA